MNISYEVLGFNSLYTLVQFAFFSSVLNFVMFFKLVLRLNIDLYFFVFCQLWSLLPNGSCISTLSTNSFCEDLTISNTLAALVGYNTC